MQAKRLIHAHVHVHHFWNHENKLMTLCVWGATVRIGHCLNVIKFQARCPFLSCWLKGHRYMIHRDVTLWTVCCRRSRWNAWRWYVLWLSAGCHASVLTSWKGVGIRNGDAISTRMWSVTSAEATCDVYGVQRNVTRISLAANAHKSKLKQSSNKGCQFSATSLNCTHKYGQLNQDITAYFLALQQ